MEEEKMIVCPNDPNHVIRISRFEFHLLKCQKNFSNSAIEICPFNAKHTVKRNLIRIHIAQCPDRNRLAYEHSITQVLEAPETNESFFDSNRNMYPAPSSNFGTTEECWDTDINRAPVIQPRPGRYVTDFYANKSKSQRKQYREEMVEEFKKKANENEKQNENVK